MQNFIEQIDVTPEVVSFSFANLKGGDVYNRQFNAEKETLFQAASVAKLAFSFLCAILANKKSHNRNQLDLDAPVVDLVTEINIPKIITLRHLINHVSGFDNDHGFTGWNASESLPELAAIIQDVAFSEKLHGHYHYSGMNYCVAQLYLERFYDRTLNELASEEIFIPLEMQRSSFSLEPKDGDYVCGYDINNEKLFGDYLYYPMLAAGGLWTNPSEMMLLVRNIFDCMENKNSALTSKPMLQSFMNAKSSLFTYEGWNLGYCSRLLFNTNLKEAYYVMTNFEKGHEFIQKNFPEFL